MVLSRRPWAFVQQGEHQKAIADCDDALKLDPILALAYHARGQARKSLGQMREAEADQRQAAALDPRFAK